MTNTNILTYKEQRVLTTRQLAEVYEADEQQIQQNFNNNPANFTKELHYFYLEGEELREFKRQFDDIEVPTGVSKFTSHLYLWTHRGASRHCKILDTDKAWQQFDTLEENYFKLKETPPLLQQPHDTTKAFSLGEVSNLLKLIVSVLRKQGQLESAIAEQVQMTCTQFGIMTIPNFVKKSPFEQLALEGAVRGLISEG